MQWRTARWHAWKVLESTLNRLGLSFEFVNNEASFENMTNKKFDLRIRGSSIGGGVEAWGMYVTFCSSMGINFPDPQGIVCNFVSEFENDKITEEELTQKVLENIEDEAAILPVSHYGVKLLVSDSIDTKTFSPLLAIMKFDQISLK